MFTSFYVKHKVKVLLKNFRRLRKMLVLLVLSRNIGLIIRFLVNAMTKENIQAIN